jgi:hypothetical protein
LFFLSLFSETGSHDVARVDLKLELLLPQPPEGWDYQCATMGVFSELQLPLGLDSSLALMETPPCSSSKNQTESRPEHNGEKAVMAQSKQRHQQIEADRVP